MGGEVSRIHIPDRVVYQPDGWKWTRLDDICDGVFDCPHSTPNLTTSGPYVARSQDIRSGVFRAAGAAHVSEETYALRISRAEPRPGDLLYSREGTYFGIAAEVPRGLRICLGQRMVLLRPKPSIAAARFVRFWLNSPAVASHVHGFRDGSVAERLNLPTIRALPVLLPPLAEQSAIAQILGTLDDKIELNRRMSETLEAMARALFKSWFVDFDPVRAKMKGRDSDLPKPLAALFPSRLVDSELGEIPEGWQARTLAIVSELNPETWTKTSRPAEIEYVDLANTKWGRIDAVTRYASADAPSRAQRVLRPGDTIVGTVRPGNGSYALISQVGLTASTGFAVLRPASPDCTTFVYLAATSSENLEALAHLADGGAYPAVRPELVAATPSVLPNNAVLTAFSRATDPLFATVAHKERESLTLAALRDALLPRLTSGELRLKDIEQFADAVTGGKLGARG
jgi:type I restriction enzyme S subunit